MSQVKNLQIHFKICRIYRQDSRWQQIFLTEASKLVVKRRVSKHRTVSPVIPRQTKHSWPRNLKYNREHIGANPRWHVTDLKASKHDPKAFPSTVLSFPSNQPTKVFRSNVFPFALRLSQRIFRSWSKTFHTPSPIARILDSLSTRILSKQRIARKKG